MKKPCKNDDPKQNKDRTISEHHIRTLYEAFIKPVRTTKHIRVMKNPGRNSMRTVLEKNEKFKNHVKTMNHICIKKTNYVRAL